MFTDAGKQDFRREPARFIQMLTDGCQVHVLCHIDVIKADDCDIVWNSNPLLACNLHDAQGLNIRRDK